jgi:ABC-2 type transport system permease protein
LFFLSGALYPLEGLPEPVQYLALLNPLTYGVDGLWGRWWGPGPRRNPLVVNFGALVVSSVVMVSIGAFLFERVEAV